MKLRSFEALGGANRINPTTKTYRHQGINRGEQQQRIHTYITKHIWNLDCTPSVLNKFIEIHPPQLVVLRIVDKTTSRVNDDGKVTQKEPSSRRTRRG